MPSYTKTVELSHGRGSDSLAEEEEVFLIGDITQGRGILQWRTRPFELLASGIVELHAHQTGQEDLLVLDGSPPQGPAATGWHIAWNGTELRPSPLLLAEEGLASLEYWTVNPEVLCGLTFAAEAIQEDGSSTSFYAIRIAENAYTKLRIFRDFTQEEQLKAEWLTYQFAEEVRHVGYGYVDPRDIVLNRESGTLVAYVSDRRAIEGRVHRVPWDATAKRFQTVNWASLQHCVFRSTTFHEPQQLALCQGEVYLVNRTALLKVGSPEPLYTGLVGAVGLLLDEDASVAFVTDRGPDNTGRLLRIPLRPNGGPPEVLQEHLGLSGYLEWADEARSAFYLPLPSQKKVLRVSNVRHGTPGLSEALREFSESMPTQSVRSLVKLTERLRLVLSEAEAGRLELDLAVAPSELMLGIGLVPFQYIKQPSYPNTPDLSEPDLGKADTSSTSYFFQVNKAPFGGTLHLMLNHKRAHELGARYYCIRAYNGAEPVAVPGIARNFRDWRWGVSLEGKPVWVEEELPLTRSGDHELFSVRDPDDQWERPYLGGLLHSRGLNNGLARLEVCFFDAHKRVMSGLGVSRWVLIDNTTASVSLSLPRLKGQVKPLHCGALVYGPDKDAATLQFDFAVSHPNDNALFSLGFHGAGQWRGALSVSGKPSQVDSPREVTVRQLIGNCNVATVSVVLSCSVQVTDGYQWMGGASTTLSFILVPEGTPMDE
jgi:hypothetical protein